MPELPQPLENAPPADAAHTLRLHSTDFEIFGVQARFGVQTQELVAAYHKLQNRMHPDRFANGSAAEKRLAVQWATRINEAWHRLKNPVERAIYLCQLHNHNPRANQTQLEPVLLMQQMEWREQLQESATEQSLHTLKATVLAERKRLLQQAEQQLDTQKHWQAASQTCQALLFVEKFLSEIAKKTEWLEDASDD
ncbi:MAG: Fe-S protein assembly co-chaperone HscB [Limnobacter sp.]|nr:Fe-S protein assembly co-chaperone HscB [Limnobacter sp.]